MVTWITFQIHLLEVGLTQNWETMALRNAHNCWFILSYHVWGPAWIEIHWNSIWSRDWSHMNSHYIWGFVTTLHDFGGVLGRPLDTFIWALAISSWSRLLAHVWSGHDISPCLPSRVVLDNSPTIPTNIIHTCHVRFYVVFSFRENVMGCSLYNCPHLDL